MKHLPFNREDFGKLFIRITLGILLAAQGVNFFVQGKCALASLGKIVTAIGWNVFPISKTTIVLGGIFAIFYIVCGITFAIGAFSKISSGILSVLLLLTSITKLSEGHHFFGLTEYLFIASFVLFGFCWIGAGQYAVQTSSAPKGRSFGK